MKNQPKTCKKCLNPIPEKRSELGFSVCVKCSDVDIYGCVNIINHKTGNTVQALPKSQAAAINKIGDRKRFGTVLRGGSKNNNYNPKGVKIGCSASFVGSSNSFEKVGSESMLIMDIEGLDAAMVFIDRKVSEFIINKNQAFKIKQLIQNLYAINFHK